MIKKYVLFHTTSHLGFLDENDNPNVIYYQPWDYKSKINMGIKYREITLKEIINRIDNSKSRWKDLNAVGYAEHVKAALIQLATE